MFPEKILNLELLKNDISKKLDELINDNNFNLVSFSIDFLKNPEFCLKLEEPIDLNIIRKNLYNKKYKKKGNYYK